MKPGTFSALTEASASTTTVIPMATLERAKEMFSVLLRAAKGKTMSGWPELQENPPAVLVRYGSSAPSLVTQYVQQLPLR